MKTGTKQKKAMKTGMDQASRRRGRISICTELCKGCKYCVLACPKGVIEMNNALNPAGFHTAQVVRMEECSGCALCARMCPEVAIEVWAT